MVGSSTAGTEHGGHLPADFTAQVRVLPNGCHEWTGKVNDSGYGVYRGQLAHRFAAGVVRPIPPGYVVDHTCHTQACTAPGKTDPHRRCVNRAHLEPVTNAVNAAAGPPPPKLPASGRGSATRGTRRPPVARATPADANGARQYAGSETRSAKAGMPDRAQAEESTERN